MKIKNIFLTVALLGLPVIPVSAQQAEFQLGYVFNSWTSDFISNGQEHRMPASLKFTAGDFSLLADTAFVIGNYETKAIPSDNVAATQFTANQMSDTSVSTALSFHSGPNLTTSISGQLNIPTGNGAWENQEEAGSIPTLFEPSFYHGRGWGGSLIASLASAGDSFQWGAAAGYVMTTTYDVGVPGASSFNPGDSLIAVASLGGNVSETEKLGMRAVHTFPFESKVTDPASKFTSAESTILSTQWLSSLGRDRFALNLSYSFYSRGMVADPVTSLQVKEDFNFLGDRLEIRPFLGYRAGSGVSLESGLVWKRIFANGYPVSDTGHFQAGGNLIGAEQSVTFQMSRGMFLNFAGLYHYIVNEKAATDVLGNLTNVTYNRFAIATNVGFKW